MTKPAHASFSLCGLPDAWPGSLIAITLWLLASCSGPGATPGVHTPLAGKPPVSAGNAAHKPDQAQPAKPTPPTLRLGEKARPLGYRIDLTLDPAQETFRGQVDIDIELTSPIDVLWLNAADLAIDRAEITIGDRKITAEVIAGGEDFVGFATGENLRPGPITLTASYRGKLLSHEEGGLFRRKEGDYWYIYSQFEPLDARRAFPAFDEPNFKVPYQLTLHVKKDHVALANTPIEVESDEPHGMKTVRFEPTPPLPSYLVAMAVGPFEIIDAGVAGRNKTPIRIITPRGKAGGASFAAASTGPILTLLEDYFDRPYPYAKLDQIAVPSFLGAMENPGLVTYHQELILGEKDDDTLWRQRGFAETCAHELAHMWFGDLVTMKWWDDLWLNEAFATWMEAKIVHRWKPEWELEVGMVNDAIGAMWSDSLDSARQIRQPIASAHDIDNAFDGITYGKGAAVLRMFESWIGEDKFRQGIIDYITKHAQGNADAGDFLAAMNLVGGPAVAGAVNTFIDQSGVPVITTELRCTAGQKPKLALSQRRYLPAASTAEVNRTWQIPVCVEYGRGKRKGRTCTLMTEASTEIELGELTQCPDWVMPNSDMAGYYHVDYDKSMFARLLVKPGRPLTTAERVGVIGDMAAMAQAGRLDRGDALAWVPRLHKERSRHITASTLGLSYVSEEFIPEGLEANYARFVRAMYGARARELGWKVDANEPDSTRLLRPRLLRLLAHRGGDEKLMAEGRTLIGRWLDDRKAIHPDLVDVALSVATRHGDLALWQRFHDQARATSDSKERRRLLQGMAGFEDAEIVKKNLAIVKTDEFMLLDSSTLAWQALFTPATRDLAFEFIKDNFDSLVARLPRFAASSMGFVAAAFCSLDGAQRAEDFLRPRIEKVQGGPRALDQALEQARLCAAKKEREQASIAAFLKKY